MQVMAMEVAAYLRLFLQMDPDAGDGHGGGGFALIRVRHRDRLRLRIKEIVETQNRQEVREHVLLNAARDELRGVEV